MKESRLLVRVRVRVRVRLRLRGKGRVRVRVRVRVGVRPLDARRLGLGHSAASHWKRSTLGAERALHRSVLATRWLCRSRFSVIIPWRQLCSYAHGTISFSGVSTSRPEARAGCSALELWIMAALLLECQKWTTHPLGSSVT